jgi:flagellar hook-basal body complex protein FliE
MDDVATMMINSERATTAFQLMVQMRNNVLEGYQEIMRMNV